MSRRSSPATKRYLLRLAVVVATHLLLLAAVVSGFHHFQPQGPLRYFLAALPGIPIVGAIWIFGRYMAEVEDEFERAVLVQSVLWAVGLTLSIVTVWGLLEDLAGAPRLPLWSLFSIIVVIYPCVQPAIRRRYR